MKIKLRKAKNQNSNRSSIVLNNKVIGLRLSGSSLSKKESLN